MNIQSLAISGEFDQEAARAAIEAHLERYTRFDEDCPARLREAIRYSLLGGGKRLRPLLVLMACHACGEDPQKALPAACAVEMIHTYSLIHDDLPSMDDDQLRRGKPTLHVQFDEALAILAGDALIPLAFQVLAAEYPPSQSSRCCLELAMACGASHLVGGQVDDLEQEGRTGGSLTELEQIHRRKTGALLTVSLRMGGLVANAEPSQLESLESYGRDLGLAFQIVDDLLDCRGDWTKMGKLAGQDTSRGKMTFPGMVGIQSSEQRAESLVQSATESLTGFGDRAESLRKLAQYILNRNH